MRALLAQACRHRTRFGLYSAVSLSHPALRGAAATGAQRPTSQWLV